MRLNGAQEKLLAKVKLYQDEVGSLEFQESPCPLLVAQIEEAQVLAGRLAENLRLLRETMDAEGNRP